MSCRRRRRLVRPQLSFVRPPRPPRRACRGFLEQCSGCCPVARICARAGSSSSRRSLAHPRSSSSELSRRAAEQPPVHSAPRRTGSSAVARLPDGLFGPRASGRSPRSRALLLLASTALAAMDRSVALHERSFVTALDIYGVAIRAVFNALNKEREKGLRPRLLVLDGAPSSSLWSLSRTKLTPHTTQVSRHSRRRTSRTAATCLRVSSSSTSTCTSSSRRSSCGARSTVTRQSSTST